MFCSNKDVCAPFLLYQVELPVSQFLSKISRPAPRCSPRFNQHYFHPEINCFPPIATTKDRHEITSSTRFSSRSSPPLLAVSLYCLHFSVALGVGGMHDYGRQMEIIRGCEQGRDDSLRFSESLPSSPRRDNLSLDLGNYR